MLSFDPNVPTITLTQKMQNKTIRFKDDRIEFNLNTIYYES